MKELFQRFAGLDRAGIAFLTMIACVAFSSGVFAGEFGVLANSNDIRRRPSETVAQIMQRLGYEFVALSCSADQLATSAKAYRDHGIEIGAVYVGLTVTPTAATFSIPIENVWAALKKRGLLLVHVTKSAGPQAADERIAKVLRGLADQADSLGVTVAIYPHVGDRLPTIESAVAVAKAVDRPNLGVCFTLCHYLKQSPPDGLRQALREARPLLKAVTINGSDTGDTQSMNWDRLIQPLGQGSFDLPGLMRFLEQDLSYAGPVYVQLYNINTPAEELLEATLSAWKAMHEKMAEEK